MNELITTEQAGRCLGILKQATEPMVAAEIARRLGIGGSHETRRRYVREIIRELREGGSKIIATIQDGYWLTEDEGLWLAYNEHRAIDAKQILGETGRRKRMIDGHGQGKLFDDRIQAGCATVGAG